MSTTTLWTGHRISCLDHGYVELLDYAGSDTSIVSHARTSTGKDKEIRSAEDDKKLLLYLYRNRHTSPFEMAKMWFEVQLPIFVWRQWIRHRTQSINEVSGRYSKLPDLFYIPADWRRQATTNKQSSISIEGGWNPIVANVSDTEVDLSEAVRLHCTSTYRTYELMLEAGVAKEMARMILPLNIYTRMHVCWDLHNLLHFIRLRNDAHAQSEIQEYGVALSTFVQRCFPWTYEAFLRYKVKVIDVEEVTP